MVKNPRAIRETWVLSLGRSPGGRYGNPLQYFCLENPPGESASMELQRVRHNWATNHTALHI